MKKTEKRLARMETNQANVETKLVNSEKNIETRLDNSEKNMNEKHRHDCEE